MRRPLAHQVRSPQQAVRARRNAGRFICQPFVRISTIIRSGTELIAEPSQRQTRALGHSHDVPAVRQSMTERMHAALQIE
jgi:hypothetical protein